MSGEWRAIDPAEDLRIVPEPDGLAADFYERLARGTLHLQRCAGCGTHRHPPRWRCPACGSDAFAWAPSPGRGTLFTWTVTHRPIDPGWAKIALPYATLVVELDEGVRLVGVLEGCAPSDLALGMPMQAVIERKSERFAFLWFRPAG